MPFDWASIMQMLGQQTPNTTTGSQMGGQLPPGGGPALMQPTPQLAPGSMGPQPPAGGGGLMGGGMMGPLAAAAGMLNASGPSRMPVGLGQVMGQGIGGFMQGHEADRQLGLQQQQQAALGKIAAQLGQPPGATPNGGALPPGILHTGLPPGNPPVMMPGAPPGGPPSGGLPSMLPPPGGASAMPTVPPPGPIPGPPPAIGGPPMVPGAMSSMPAALPGGIPPGLAGLGGGGMMPGRNPFLAQMMQRRRGMMG